MYQTKKIFETNSHLAECTAKVLSCQYDADKNRYEIILDQTVFFPEGGGQFADLGVLKIVASTYSTENVSNATASSATAPTATVSDVQIVDDVILHYTDAPLEVGTTVTAKIDWDRRFDFMQQHSAEHIVSGLVFKKYGFHNVGFHLGLTETTLDFDGPLTPADIQWLEYEANQAIYKNIAFDISFPDKETLATLPYRSKKPLEGDIRIVTLPGYDICACCAPHVNTTGEIGIIKIVSFMAHRGGMRLTILCGNRALSDYQAKQRSVEQISALLSVKQPLVTEGVAKAKQDQANLITRINALQQMVLEEVLRNLPSPEDTENIILFQKDLDMKAIRDAVNNLCTKYAGYCGIFVGDDESGYNFVLGSSTKDCTLISHLLKEKFGAKSGGSKVMVQGNVCAAQDAIRQIF